MLEGVLAAMIGVTIALVGLSLLCLIVLLLLARGTGEPAHTVEEVMARFRPLDIAAFRNLVDPDEEQFLRANLSGEDWASVQRMRMTAAADYVRRASVNAALVLRLATMARRSGDAQVTRAAEEIINNALRMRVYSLLALAKIQLRIAFPAWDWSPAVLIDRYESMRQRVEALTRVQFPAHLARVESSL